MDEYPPIDVLGAAWLNSQKPKPIGEQASNAGLPVKKGKVRKRGDIGR
jgi:hypothetical protein